MEYIKDINKLKSYFDYHFVEKINNDDLKLINHFQYYCDKIFILNLKERPDRWYKTREFFDKHKITNYERYDAINGYDYKTHNQFLSLNYKNIKNKYNNKNKMSFPVSYGIILSTLNIIKIAKQRNYKSILLLQDDCIFIKDFFNKFQIVMSDIENYKLVYLGGSQHDWTNISLQNLRVPFYFPKSPCMGCFAVMINSTIFDELIKTIEETKFMPIDAGALSIIQKKYLNDCYVLYPNLIISDIRDSDIRLPRPLNNSKFKWESKLYNVMNL